MIFDKLSSQILMLIHVLPGLNRLQSEMGMKVEVSSEQKDKRHILCGDVKFTNVSLQHPDNGQLILDNISLHIPSGKFIAIIGQSGAGKSSLLKLLLGFESASAGSVLLDNININQLNIQNIRQQLGVVMQTTNIFPGTIFSNIAAQADITHDEAWHLAHLVGLADDINAMPMKMHTYISDNAGESISGGQKQKILIARALAAKPRILLLDEATSALDNKSQSLIFNNLNDLAITRIVIAHRYSTIAAADWVYRLEQGRVVGSGSYAELCLKDSLLAS